MRRILRDLLILMGAGGLIWAAFAHFTNLPDKPSLVSMEKEREIGENVKEALFRINGFEPLTPQPAGEVLRSIEKRIESVDSSASDISIEIIDNGMINAFALPGGFIVVTTALIEFCETPDEFIAVVCHEAAHVVNRHVLNRLITSLGVDILISGDPFVSGEIARTLLNTRYSRAQERTADIYSSNTMTALGLEPRALASFLRRVKSTNPSFEGYPMELISTHPDSDRRIREILSFEIPEDFTSEELWFDWDSFVSRVDESADMDESNETDEGGDEKGEEYVNKEMEY